MDIKENSATNEKPETAPQEDIKDIWQRFKIFLKELLDIRQGTDHKATIEGITKDIPFKGHTAWILIFSILIASIGLNTNSTAVVIGAMLISPLMGPILGIGLSVGINDIDTLRRSLTNFGVMVFLSVLTAFIYFKISPFQTASSEILARIEPTLLDVLIAVFGGLAGIVAGSRKEKSNAIPGVAIATALMPPLCTAGFGLATGNLEYFLGALFLFGINTVFIALSTFVVVKYLRFPLVKYANAPKRKRVNRIVAAVALLFIIPSIFSFMNIIERTFYEKEANFFLTETIIYQGAEPIKNSINAEEKTIEVYLIGNNVPKNIIENWQEKIQEIPRLAGSKLLIRQGHDKTDQLASELSSKVKEGVLQDLYSRNSTELSNKDAKILLLENEINRLTLSAKKQIIPLNELTTEAKINYEGIKSLSYANVITSNLKKVDTSYVLTINWDKKMKSKLKTSYEEKLTKWLRFKLKMDNLIVKGI